MGSLPRGDCRSNYENGQEVGRMRETEEGLTIRAFSLSPSKGQPDSNIRKVVNLRHRITLRVRHELFSPAQRPSNYTVSWSLL